ncbi:MAG TPA: pantoate--beta-alanine ligase [Terriglobia bacterium]|nr:pantoate--beta-alanine ligase [Terriglobia bacterium]
MQLITSIDEMGRYSRELHAKGRQLALVPTMGALHEGHLSLVRRAQCEADAVVVSIFVNPTQFGPDEDYTRYPRNIERDLELLEPFQVAAVFQPDVQSMYPPDFDGFVEPGALAQKFEGAVRPGHFRGVATVVVKLFNIVQPDVACFGQKDFQQAVIVRRLIADLNLGIRLVLGRIVREPDGVAMSSRHAYLSAEDRVAARVLGQSLSRAQQRFAAGETRSEAIVEEMKTVMGSEARVMLDYAAVVDPYRLEPVERVAAGAVALVAARVGPARLIDNLILAPAGASDEERLRLVFGKAMLD